MTDNTKENTFKNNSSADKNPCIRKNIKPGISVQIVLKKDQISGKLTSGVVKEILTNSASHPHGIKVRLLDGNVGRVKKIEQKNKE